MTNCGCPIMFLTQSFKNHVLIYMQTFLLLYNSYDSTVFCVPGDFTYLCRIPSLTAWHGSKAAQSMILPVNIYHREGKLSKVQVGGDSFSLPLDSEICKT